MKVLVIEDDVEISNYSTKGLKEAGNTVDQAFCGADGFFMAVNEPYDVMIIDRMLPKLNGIAVIKSLRGAQITTPILILSALAEVDDRVEGLNCGADDYLIKPFAFAELQARLDALGRRMVHELANETHLKIADLEIDLLSRRVKRDGKLIILQPREFSLLEYLVKHQGQVVTRTMLLESVWDYKFDPQTNVIDVHISRLRNKIDKGFKQSLLKTVRGAGYMIAQGG